MRHREDVLVFVARKDGMPPLSRAMRQQIAESICDFCSTEVSYNRQNINQIRSKGNNPVLICPVCYGQGAHVKQGYGRRL